MAPGADDATMHQPLTMEQRMDAYTKIVIGIQNAQREMQLARHIQTETTIAQATQQTAMVNAQLR